MTLTFLLCVLVAALAITIGYLVRLNEMHWRETSRAVIAMHLGLLGAILSTAGHAVQDLMLQDILFVDLQDICALVAAGTWLWLSRKSWEHGVPDYLKRAK